MTDDYSGPFEPGPEDPLLNLPPGVALHSTLIEKALRDWASKLNGADPLKRLSQRARAIQELKDYKVTGAKDLVDAAINSAKTKPGAGQGPKVDVDKLRAEAAEALNHERPLEHFEESCRAIGLGGSIVIPKMVYLSATSRVLSVRGKQHAHLHVIGPASSGKTFETDVALAHLPDNGFEKFVGASPRALIYHEGSIQHRVLYYAEMDSIPRGADESDASGTALTYLRTRAADGEAKYSVVERGQDGKMHTNHYTRKGPAVVLVTGTSRLSDDQLRSRLHELEVPVDKARLASVLKAQARMLTGAEAAKPIPSIVAAQRYLQALAPLDVVIPFAPTLSSILFERIRIADPRLTRELLRITGFTAAHALLCIERRDRDSKGRIIATVDDYEAARLVVRELSTTREFPESTVKVWEVIDAIHQETDKPVNVEQVSKALLRDRSRVRRAFNALLDGGALADCREKPSKTTPHLVEPSGERPGQVLLPTAEEVVPPSTPRKEAPEWSQTHTAHEDKSGAQAEHSGARPSSMSGNDLTPLRRPSAGGKGVDSLPKAGEDGWELI